MRVCGVKGACLFCCQGQFCNPLIASFTFRAAKAVIGGDILILFISSKSCTPFSRRGITLSSSSSGCQNLMRSTMRTSSESFTISWRKLSSKKRHLPSSHSPQVGPTLIRAPFGHTRPRWHVKRKLDEAQWGSSLVPGVSAENRISPTPSCAIATAVGNRRSMASTVLGQHRAASESGALGTLAPKSTNSRHSPPAATMSASCDAAPLPTAAHAPGVPGLPPRRRRSASSRISRHWSSSGSAQGKCSRSHQAEAVRPGVYEGGCCHSSCQRAPLSIARLTAARAASKFPHAS
mmetsp:Transcript_76787/g.212156  ORF Transcript_76787/g.212156 Transcript_76787/m.212156 type:complete len:292 (+) Transcript_76787:62-937(+)